MISLVLLEKLYARLYAFYSEAAAKPVRVGSHEEFLRYLEGKDGVTVLVRARQDFSSHGHPEKYVTIVIRGVANGKDVIYESSRVPYLPDALMSAMLVEARLRRTGKVIRDRGYNVLLFDVYGNDVLWQE